jgi:hypothetical protein
MLFVIGQEKWLKIESGKVELPMKPLINCKEVDKY